MFMEEEPIDDQIEQKFFISTFLAHVLPCSSVYHDLCLLSSHVFSCVIAHYVPESD